MFRTFFTGSEPGSDAYLIKNEGRSWSRDLHAHTSPTLRDIRQIPHKEGDVAKTRCQTYWGVLPKCVAKILGRVAKSVAKKLWGRSTNMVEIAVVEYT